MYHTLTRFWPPPTPLWPLCIKGGYLCLAKMGSTLVCLADFSAYQAKLRRGQECVSVRYSPMSIEFEKVVKIDPWPKKTSTPESEMHAAEIWIKSSLIRLGSAREYWCGSCMWYFMGFNKLFPFDLKKKCQHYAISSSKTIELCNPLFETIKL